VLKVKLLHPDAKVPTVNNLGEDHGYDVYSIEDVVIHPGQMAAVRTGIAIEFDPPAGGRMGERSSMGKKGIAVRGGEIDAGYRGEITVMLQNNNLPSFFRFSHLLSSSPDRDGVKVIRPDYRYDHHDTLHIRKGDKIAQLVREDAVIRTAPVQVTDLSASSRGANGFGSSGR
jgi:dUTP pyrophosphatase